MSTNGTLPSWFYVVEPFISFTFMITVAITIPLYMLIILVMFVLRKQVYYGMFYRIFIVGAIIDIIALTNNYIGAIFPAKGWFVQFYLSHGSLFGHIYLVLAWGTRFSQGLTVTILALNRATAVCSPIKHKQIWNSKYSRLVFIPQFGFGIAIGALLIPQQFYWKFQVTGYYIQFEDLKYREFFFTIAFALDAFFVLIIIISNITMILVFRRKYRTKQNSSFHGSMSSSNTKVMSEKQRQELNLSVVSFVTCFLEITYFAYLMYAFLINKYMNTQVFYLIYNALQDLYCGISAWLMLLLCKQLRNQVFTILKCGAQLPAQNTFRGGGPSSVTGMTAHPQKTFKIRISARGS